jgi:hypothetical protein
MQSKTRPNEPCPCGSGKKFKKCGCRTGARIEFSEATVFERTLREVEIFRAALPFSEETARVWDGFEDNIRQHPHDDSEGIELGWTVGILVMVASENGGGEDFLRCATQLVDQAVEERRWSELDRLAFRILGAELLLRSCLATVPVDHEHARKIGDLLTRLHAQLNGHGIHMPPDWRATRSVKA